MWFNVQNLRARSRQRREDSKPSPNMRNWKIIVLASLVLLFVSFAGSYFVIKARRHAAIQLMIVKTLAAPNGRFNEDILSTH